MHKGILCPYRIEELVSITVLELSYFLGGLLQASCKLGKVHQQFQHSGDVVKGRDPKIRGLYQLDNYQEKQYQTLQVN